MIQADDLSLTYGGEPVLEGASFSIQKGERCGLIGRNGSGKSSLFRLLSRQEEPDGGVVVLPRGYRLGILQQNIVFTKPTVLEEAALGLRDPDELYKIESFLFGLGFDEEMLAAPPGRLSGGYQLRVQLAKVLASEPDCLLLDEPTNYLDILSIRFLSKFLQQWKGEMILISHDLEFLDQATTHMMAIHRHKIHKIKGKSSDLFHLIAEEEERYELTRLTLEKKTAGRLTKKKRRLQRKRGGSASRPICTNTKLSPHTATTRSKRITWESFTLSSIHLSPNIYHPCLNSRSVVCGNKNP
jgi:ATP-binding cassette subfamily F protein 3